MVNAADPAQAKEPPESIPESPQEMFDRDYVNQMPSLAACEAMAKRKSAFGDVSAHFHWRFKGRLEVKASKSLGAEIGRCVARELRDFAQTVYEGFGRNDDFEHFIPLGTARDLLPDAKQLVPLWIAANRGGAQSRRAAIAALGRVLPPDVTVQDGCLAIAPAGQTLATAAHAWLDRNAGRIDSMWADVFRDLAPRPNTHLHLLASPPPFLVRHTEGFFDGSKPVRPGFARVDTWCLLKIDARRLKSVEREMAAKGRCWSGGPLENISRPRFRFPGGRKYTRVRTTDRERACALDADGGVTCCGPTRVSLPGRYLDLDMSEDLVCTVAESGAGACTNLEYGFVVSRLPGKLRSVSANQHGACGVTTDGRIVCGPRLDSQPAPPPGTFREVNARAFCGIRGDGELLCWPGGNARRVGKGPWLQMSAELNGRPTACALHHDGSPWCWTISDPNASLHPAPTALKFTHISGSAEKYCGTVQDCRLRCWSGESEIDDQSAPCFREVSLGSPSCAVTAAGEIRCWGGGWWGGDVRGGD